MRRISLWLLGGLSELEDEPPTPRADAVVAAMGPLTSLGLGGGFAGLALLTRHGLPSTAFAWLAGVNLLLGAFNLLPGAPLDGGRLLRAVLWARTGNRCRAVDAAARAGRAFGLTLVAVGVFAVLAGASAPGLWLFLIGWFIASGATAERYANVAYELRGLTVSDVMAVPPATVPNWWTVADLLTYLGRAHALDDVFVLVDLDGQPTGLATVPALIRVPAAERDTTRLRDCRSAGRPALRVTPETPLDQLVGPLRLRGGIAAVVQDGRVTATVTLRAVGVAAERVRLGVAADVHR